LWSYGASYFFIKFIRYALLFWLPYYLSVVLGYSGPLAGKVSTAFEIGGPVGVIVLGTLSDRVKMSRPALSALALVGLAGALLLYLNIAKLGVYANAVGFAAVGAFLFGPDALLSGASSQDAGGPLAAATATGMVNGIGSVGTVAVGLLLPVMSENWGWQALFPTLLVFALLAALALLPAIFAHRRQPPRDIQEPL
jgi:sugar phosphate permease